MKRSNSAVSALSIRNLLVLLLVINAAALALLSGVSIMSNGEIRGSQRDLIEISDIQANRSEILTAVQGLLVRQSQIMAAASSKELQAAADRSALESTSRESMAALHRALSNPLLHSARAETELQGLSDAFASLLSADNDVFQRTQEILRLDEQQRSLAAELETAFTLFQSSAADLSNDVDFTALSAQIAMKKLLRAAPDDPSAPNQVEQYREAGKRLISDEIRRAKDLIAQVQLEIASLAALTGTIIQPHDASSLTTLIENRLRPLIESIDSALKQLVALLASSDMDAGDQGLQQQLEQLKAQLLDAPESLALTAAAITESREAQGIAVASQQAATHRVTTALAALGQITDSKRTEVAKATTSRLDGTQMTILAVSGLTLLVALGIGGGIIFLVLRPLRCITAALQDIGQGEGDLSKRLAPGSVVEINALANGFNHFAAKVESLVANVVDASHRLRDQAGRSAEVSHQISEQLRQHQHETDRVAASLSDLSQSIAMVAANGQHASDTAHQAKDQASTGRGIVEDSRSAIEALAAEINEAATSLITLGQDTSNVNRVLDVINGVAEQTNLLALNAAIEAARAGEQGRGFAVVAEEVRTLASKTQESTIEIAEILERLRSGSAAVSSTISASHEKATAAVALANDTNQTFDGIADAIASINQMSGDISSAVLGQSEATDAIDSQVGRIHAASLATAEEAERAAQMAAELADLGRELASMVAQFKVGS